MKKSALLFCIILGLFSCNENKEMENSRITTTDYQKYDSHSFSKPKEAAISHLKWDAEVDFENKAIHAVAQYDIRKSPNASKSFWILRI